MTAPRLRPVQLVVGAAGYGKTTALRDWFPGTDVTWFHGADAVARLATIGRVEAPATIVLDDLPPLSVPAAEALFAALPGLPDGVRFALASRFPPPISTARWRGRGLLAEVGPAALALSEDRVADVLASEYGLADLDLAERLHEATAGWPALVHLAGEALSASGATTEGGADLAALADRGTALRAYLVEEVIAALPAELLDVLRDVCDLVPVEAGLVGALGHARAAEAAQHLTATGLLTGDGGTARVVPLVAWVVRDTAARTPAARRAVAAAAAGWYEEHGPAVAAATAYRRAGLDGDCLRVLDEHGDAILAAGDSSALITLLSPVRERSRRLQLLLGDALRVGGDVATAASTYAALTSAGLSGGDGSPAGAGPLGGDLAWRLGLVDYLRGNPRAALATYARAGDVAPADAAHLAAWRATAHLQLGETATATELATTACELATRAHDDAALATAHIALALCRGIAGDPADSEEHYALVLRIAERAGDVVLRARVLTNQAYRQLCEGRYGSALDLAAQAAHWARVAGHTNLRCIALCNHGDASYMLGRYDDAVRDYERALALCRRMGSRRSAAALLGLGEVQRRRGWLEQARSAYEAAVRTAEEGGDNQVLVCAIAGLARVHDDPAEAAALAARAVAQASDKVVVTALLAQGWVALRAGDRVTTEAAATEAARVARAHRDRAGLAESLELRAGLESTVVRARAALREAETMWTDAGAVVDAARCQVALGDLPEASTDDRLGALLAGETLAAAGVHRGQSGGTGDAAPGAVSIRALGRFEVLVGGRVVPAQQWQSKKARDLLRILVSRRGRPVPRGELCELLWPDDDPGRTGHRLSVLLSIVRGVLDPDRAVGADHFVVADQSSIALDVSRVDVDLERFLADVAHGRRLRERGALAQLRLLLADAVGRYRGEAFEGEPYDEWSGPVRGEARTAYLGALRALAHASHALGDHEEAVRYLQRLLGTDPYDEASHRRLVELLVASGQHGEAARAFAAYGDAMREIGARPPDVTLLAPRTAGHRVLPAPTVRVSTTSRSGSRTR